MLMTPTAIKPSTQSIGAIVRLWRTERKLKQSDLAEKAGLVQSAISELERGHIGNYEKLARVAAAFETSLSELVAAAERLENFDAPLSNVFDGLSSIAAIIDRNQER